MNTLQENNREIITKKGKGKLPLFCGSVERLIQSMIECRDLK